MPHIYIEHSKNISSLLHSKDVAMRLVSHMEKKSFFLPNTIKISYVPIEHFFMPYNDPDGSFIHATVKIFSGRTVYIKQDISFHLMYFLENLINNLQNKIYISVDIYEIDKQCYNLKLIDSKYESKNNFCTAAKNEKI